MNRDRTVSNMMTGKPRTTRPVDRPLVKVDLEEIGTRRDIW